MRRGNSNQLSSKQRHTDSHTHLNISLLLSSTHLDSSEIILKNKYTRSDKVRRELMVLIVCDKFILSITLFIFFFFLLPFLILSFFSFFFIFVFFIIFIFIFVFIFYKSFLLRKKFCFLARFRGRRRRCWTGY